jgi:uncharacterized protein YggE
MKWNTLKLSGALVLTAVLAGCGSVNGSTVAPSYSMADTLTVTGYGEARSDPDMATISVGVNISDTEISAAVERSNELIADITAALLDMGIVSEDIQTTGFNIWPEDVWDPTTSRPTGEKRYHVDSTMQVNIRTIGNVGKVLETALNHGANNVYGLNFGIQETGPLTAEARTAAIADARQRAQAMAQELGVTLGEVSSASDQSGGVVYPNFVGAGYGIGGGAGEPPISQGQMSVSVSVSVTFEITH